MNEMIDGQALASQKNPSDWRSHLTDDLKADPVVSGWAEKASEKDIPSILKGYAHAQKRMGSAINLPGKDAKPEELTALRSKLYETGVFAAPPAKPEEYGLTDPGNLPEGVKFSPELAGKFAEAMHKHGIPKAALADLMPVYLESMQGRAEALKVDSDKINAELRDEYKDKFDEREELADRLAKDIFKGYSDEGLKKIKDSGMGALLLKPLFKLAHLAGQDSSYIESLGPKPSNEGGNAAKELERIMTDKTHPKHAGYYAGDQAVHDEVAQMFKAAYPVAR
jgi:hypothetical protein